MAGIRKRALVVMLVLCTWAAVCGAGWFDGAKVAIDTERNPVYRYCQADEVISAFASDRKAAKEAYEKEYVLLLGKVAGVGKDGKNLVLCGTAQTGLTIECSYGKELRSSALAYGVGDNIGVYGQITVDVISGDVGIKAKKMILPPSLAMGKDRYYLLDGSFFDKADAKKVTLKGGGVEYYIPSSWKKAEHSIMEEGLGSMEGYQYVLNNTEGGWDSAPESLFICYFDNKTQLADYLNDSGEAELIEKAIVENILGSVGKFPSKKVKTYYGSRYTYYSGAYKNALETGAGYHTEFIFQARGEEGIVVVLYVYKDAEHISDVLFVTRFLEMIQQ